MRRSRFDIRAQPGFGFITLFVAAFPLVFGWA